MAIRHGFLVLTLLAAAAAPPALAQSPAPATSGTAHAAPHAAPHATKKPVPRKSSPNAVHHGRLGTPVVTPRHGVAPRKPAHRAAPLATQEARAGAAAPVPAKPAPKPVPAKPAAPAKPPVPADQGTVTGLHLPRFASLKTDDVNMRSGPGSRYPVLWIYKRRELPVKIEREFDVWRLVEDMDGIKGWVHQATLTGRRSFVVTGADARTMRADPADSAGAVAVLKPGVVGRIRACDANAAWCQVQVGDYRGWLARADFWGTDAGETVTP